MDIKRNKKEKLIQLFGGLIGICVAVVSLFYFFHAEKAEAEKRKTNPAARRSAWNLCGGSLLVLFLPRRKSGSREKNGGDCKLCESAVFHLHPL